jgi:hypothetical protein
LMRALDHIVVQWLLQLPWQQLRHSIPKSTRMCGGWLCILCCLFWQNHLVHHIVLNNPQFLAFQLPFLPYNKLLGLQDF